MTVHVVPFVRKRSSALLAGLIPLVLLRRRRWMEKSMRPARILPLFTAAALVLWLSCHVSARQARSFFIDPVSGSDLADGRTEQTPWKSADRLQRGPLVAGDRVLFKAATTHRGAVSVSGAGNRKAPVLIGSYGEGKPPVIDGMGAPSAFVISNPDFLIIQDLEITNPADQPAPRNGLLIQAGDGTTAQGIVVRRLHVHHVSGHDDRNGGCGIFLAAGRSPAGKASRYEEVRIEDCWLHDVPFNGILLSGWETRGRDSRGELENASSRIIIRGNLLHDVAGDAICIITTKGAVIEHNEVYRACLGQTRGNPEAYSAGIWPNSSDGTIMRWNRVEGLRGKKDGQAFDVDVDCRDTVVEHNVSRNNGKGFLLLCATMDGANDCATLRTIVRNNLSVDDCAEPPGALVTLVSRVKGVLFENNAFVIGGNGARRFIYAGNWLSKDWPEDIVWKRNLIVTADTLYSETGALRGMTFESNLWSGTFRNPHPDERAVSGNPLFKRNVSETFDLAVSSNSPALKTGFRPFQLSNAGLPPSSPWREQARAARER